MRTSRKNLIISRLINELSNTADDRQEDIDVVKDKRRQIIE